MKTHTARWAVLLVTAALVTTFALAYAGEGKEGKDDVVKCGDKIGESPEVSLAEVMKAPDEYLGKKVIVTGIAKEICQKKGCWMQVLPKDGEQSIRMTFKDYGFFVPMDGQGMMVRAEGIFEMKKLEKDHVDHLLAEGAKLTVNEDGTADELGFVAAGVVMSGERKAVNKAEAAAENGEKCPHDGKAEKKTD